jgi:hypothetical protein
MKRTILLAAALLLVAAPAGAQTPPPWSAPGVDCADYFAKTTDYRIKMLRDIGNEPETGSSEVPALYRSMFTALIAECYYTRADYAKAAPYYRTLLADWFGKKKPHLLVTRAEGMTDADGDRIDDAVVLWHGALAFDKTGDAANARTFIDMAYDDSQMFAEGSPRTKLIAADYKRLDPKRPAQVAAQQAAADRAEERRFAAAAAEYAKQFKGDRHKVALERGRPCRKSTSDSALGHIEIWYYGCASSAGIGNESFTFRNGSLVDHTRSE